MVCDRFLGNIWGVMVGFQICSLILSGAGTVLSFQYTISGDTVPILTLFCCYSIMFLITVWMWRPSKTPWWAWIIVGTIGVADDWTAVAAYNYTSLASAMLLVTTVIFWVAPISYFVFGRKINWIQAIAMVIAIVGVSMVLVAQGTEGSHLKGNLLSLLSAILYAISSVLQEKLIKDDSKRVYVSRYSLVTMLWGAILTGSVEHKLIKNFNWNYKSILLMLGYALLLAMFYLSVPIVLEHSNASVFNISMLTSNFYSLLIDILVFNGDKSWLYLVGFVCIPIAVFLFVHFETKPNKVSAEEEDNKAEDENKPEEQKKDSSSTSSSSDKKEADDAESHPQV